MVTKNEQMAPIVQPKMAILIAVAFVVIAVVAFFMGSAPKPVATTPGSATFTQDSGNQPGAANNSMSAGGTSHEIKGAPGQNSVLPSK